MSYINLPVNFQDLFSTINDRLNHIELGYNGPQESADVAQSTAVSAQALSLQSYSLATTAQIQAINAGIQANQAASQATIAQSQATIASTQATNAQTTADGKNQVYYSTSDPGATANKVGDIWYKYGTTGTYANQVIAQYSGAGGTSWTPVTVSGLVIANISAGAITTGTLSAIEITAGSGTNSFHVSPSGYMSAQGVYVKGNITADSGTFNGTINATAGYFGSATNYWSIGSSGITGVGSATITGGLISGSSIYIGSSGQFQVDSSGNLNATNATITGTITSSSGTIGGWSISSTRLSSTGSYLDSAGNILLAGTFSAVGSVTGGSLVSNAQLVVTGATTLSSTATVSGNLTARSFLYNPGYDSTTGAANMRINTISGLIAYTSSSQRYKVEIQEQTIPASSILALNPKSYVDKHEFDEKGSAEGLQRWLGLIAEDIDQIPILKDLLVEYNEEGQPNSVYYDRVATALIPLLKDHEARLAKLEGANGDTKTTGN
jgi:hypothetical protein